MPPRHLFQDERGFSLIEAVIALVIIFGLMLGLLRTLDTSVRVLVETRRQAAASAFASELIERAQALEWEHMGLAVSTKGTSCGAEQIGCYLPLFPGDLTYDAIADDYLFGGETVVFSNADTFKPFLNFYEQVDRDDTTFERYLFVTSVLDGLGDEVDRRLTAVVQWLAPSGFREDVRLTALVSEYVQPAQPLIEAVVTTDLGKIGIITDPDIALPLGNVAGTSEELFFREALAAEVFLPTVHASASSDYVSSASVRVTGLQGDGIWSGPDYLISTSADNTLRSYDPADEGWFADDDASSGLPLNDAPPSFRSLPQAIATEAAPQDVVAAELDVDGTFDLDPADSSNVEVLAAAYTQHVAAPGADDLPYTEVAFDAAEQYRIGFQEYTSPLFRARYAAFPLADGPGANSLNLSSYDFVLYRRGLTAAPSSSFDGIIDRDRSTTQIIQIDQFAWSGPDIALFRDDAYAEDLKARGKFFEGWVRIELPDITVIGIEAGEGLTAVSPSVIVTGDVIVSYWDPGSENYDSYDVDDVSGFNDYDDFSGDCSSTPNALEIPMAPVFHSQKSSGEPWIDYSIEGSVVVHPWCTSVKYDADGYASEVIFQIEGPIVEGAFNISMYDSVLFDDFGLLHPVVESTVVFEGDRLSATAVFVNPTAGS